MQTKHQRMALVVVFSLMASMGVVILSAPATSAFEEGEAPNLDVHFNLKDDDTVLTPQTKADRAEEEARKTVYASFDDYGVARANRDWVDVGTWESVSVLYDQTVHFNTANLWWSEDGSSGGNDCDWRFTVRQNGEDIGAYTVTQEADHENGVLEETFGSGHGFNVPDISLVSGDTISVYIEYQGWEDIVLHYDNATYDSGFVVGGTPLTYIGVQKSGSNLNFEFVDAWKTSWTDNIRGEYIVLIDSDNILNTAAEAKEGQERPVANGSTAESTIVTWSSVTTPQVTILLDFDAYDPFDNSSSDKALVTLAVTASTSGGDGDDSPSLGFGGALIALAVVAIYMLQRRKNG